MVDNTTVGPTEGNAPLEMSGLDDMASKQPATESQVSEVKRVRVCTDLYCLCLFLFFNACLWTLSGWSYKDGYPFRLEKGWDMYGNFCGDKGLVASPYTFFPVPLQSIDLTMCLPGCPAAVALESLCMYNSSNYQVLLDEGCFNAYPSKPFFNSYCLPADYHQRKKVLQWLYSPSQVMTRVAWDILAIAGLIAGAVMILYIATLKVKGTCQTVMRIPVYFLSKLALLFLLAALCFLIYEESWRVDGKICDSLGTVQMEQCNEGDTANGYRDLCWVLIAISAVIVAVWACLVPRAFKGLESLQLANTPRKWDPLIFFCPAVMLILGVVFYTYFITLVVYQVSTGEYVTTDVPVLPQGEVQRWTFHAAERVLVFFTIGMILWWLSFLAHVIEFVTASLAIRWFYNKTEPTLEQLRITLKNTGRYHLGSILLASVLVPLCRLPRNVSLGIKSLFDLCVSTHSNPVAKCCLWAHEACFKYMTSTALTYQVISGRAFLSSARQGHDLLVKHKNFAPQKALNDGERLIWLTQLVVTMIGPVFVAYWIQHKALTFRDISTREITSVAAMAIYALFLTWYLAQVYGGVVRGLMYGSVMLFILHEDSKPKRDTKEGVEYPGLMTEGALLNRDAKVTPRDSPAEVEKVGAIPRNVTTQIQDLTTDGQQGAVPPPSRGGAGSPRNDIEDPDKPAEEGTVQMLAKPESSALWFQS